MDRTLLETFALPLVRNDGQQDPPPRPSGPGVGSGFPRNAIAGQV